MCVVRTPVFLKASATEISSFYNYFNQSQIGSQISIALQNYQCPFDSETLNRSIDLILDPFNYL